MQSSLFSDPSLFGSTNEEKRAIELLRSKGYLVRAPSKYYQDLCENSLFSNLNNSKDLVEFFYLRKYYYFREEDYGYTFNKKEISIAKKFIESRVKTGVAEKRAIVECANIIETVLKYSENFKLDFISMSLFGQQSMKWVTDKAVSIINEKQKQLKKDKEILEKEALVKRMFEKVKHN